MRYSDPLDDDDYPPARHSTGCLCFAPGEAPGSCPGPDACPLCNDEEDEDND